MKNGLIIWNVILSAAVGVLLYMQLGKKNKNASKTSAVISTDTTTNRQFRIAYFEMDSLENNFNLVKDVKAEIASKEADYTRSINQIDNIYRNKYNELNGKAETMTQEERAAAQNTLLQLGEDLKAQKQKLDEDYQKFVMLKNIDVKKKIEDYLRIFNEQRNYSYIISYEPGLFYLKDTAYNITADLIKGLNGHYKQVKKP